MTAMRFTIFEDMIAWQLSVYVDMYVATLVCLSHDLFYLATVRTSITRLRHHTAIMTWSSFSGMSALDPKYVSVKWIQM